MAWFKYNGYRTDSLGIVVQQMPAFPRAKRRIMTYTIPGRSGVLTVPDAFEPVAAQARICLLGQKSRDFINAWLTPAGDLVLSDDPERRYKVRIDDQLIYERYMVGEADYSSVVITFTAEPFRYMANPIEISPASGSQITNPGTWYAEPTIYLRGSGAGKLTIGGTEYEFTGLSTAADFVIDSRAGKAYLNAATGSARMAGDTFPQIPVGNSTITYTGLTSLRIVPEWRWL